MILKIQDQDQRSPKDQDQFEIDLDHPKDRDHQCDLERSRSKIAILPISDEVQKKDVTYLNDDRTPCQQKPRTEEISTCIQHYIENKMRCQLPWHNQNTTFPQCIKSDQYVEFLNTYLGISSQNEAWIAKVTGCLPSCRRNEFEVKVVNRIEMPPENGKCYYSGMFYYPSGSYKEKTYYYTYEFSDYIADIGGYMGLLLGYSLISFYDGFKYMLKKILTCLSKTD